MRTNRLVTALAAAAILSGAAGYAVQRRAASPADLAASNSSATSSHPAAADGAAPRALDGRSSRHFRAGSARLYTLSSSNATTLSGNKAAAGKGSGIDLRVDGELAIAYAEPSGSRTRVRGQLRGARIAFGAQGGALDPARARVVEADLGRPFYATLEADGRVAELHVTKGISALARGVQRSLVATMQIVDRPGATWDLDEVDTTGEFHAEYRRGGDPHAITKTKTAYRRLATMHGLEAPGPGSSIAVRSTTTLSLDDDLWIRTLAAHDEIDVQPNRGMPEAHSVADASLTLISAADDASAVMSFSRDQATLELAEAGDAADALAAQRQSDELLVRGASYEVLSRAAHGGEAGERADGQARLAALFRLHPEMTERAAKRLSTGIAGAEAESLIGALSGAGHAEGQHALASVLDDASASSETRTSAAMALALAESPTHETATSLERASADKDTDVSRTSTLGMGTVARTMKDSAPDVSGASIESLLARLGGAKAPDDLVILLRALGNAGDPRVLPLAEQAYGSSDATVRMAAVTSVRLVEGAAADALIAKAMTGDPDDDVREEAVDSASIRSPEAQLPPIASVLAHDQMEKVRLEAIRALVRFAVSAPDATRLLRKASETDPSADVRELAARALGG